MKWWIKALIFSAIWIVLCIGGAYVFFPANTTPAQDAKLSELLGEICGGGIGAVWVIMAFVSGMFGRKGPDK